MVLHLAVSFATTLGISLINHKRAKIKHHNQRVFFTDAEPDRKNSKTVVLKKKKKKNRNLINILEDVKIKKQLGFENWFNSYHGNSITTAQ